MKSLVAEDVNRNTQEIASSVRFGSVRFQLKPVLDPPVRFPADVFSGTDVLGDFLGRCFFWYGCFGFFVQADVFFGPEPQKLKIAETMPIV